jgi:hypothetical protein
MIGKSPVAQPTKKKARRASFAVIESGPPKVFLFHRGGIEGYKFVYSWPAELRRFTVVKQSHGAVGGF